MAPSLTEIARGFCAGNHPSEKPLSMYAIYDRYFAAFTGNVTVLELGVSTGVSLRVWASYFPSSTIIGLDRAETGPDFSGFPNIIFESGQQTDVDRLSALCKRHAPGGFDIIVDDASHVGQNTATSYAALFPYLKSGGIYVIEDWGTGYYDDWPDGGHYQKINIEPHDGVPPKRFPSHDFGMVGFVKSLIDDVAGDHLRPTLAGSRTRTDTVDFMHVYKQLVVIKKL